MRFDRLTIKTQEALEAAQNLATEAQNPELSVEHLMLALIRQTDGIVTPIFQKLGVDIAGVTSAIAAAVQKTPKVQGAASEMRISHALQIRFGHRIQRSDSSQGRVRQYRTSSDSLCRSEADGKSVKSFKKQV